MIQYLYQALGSAAEIETQLELSKRLGFTDNTEETDKTLHSIIRMITGLIKSLKDKLN